MIVQIHKSEKQWEFRSCDDNFKLHWGEYKFDAPALFIEMQVVADWVKQDFDQPTFFYFKEEYE